jgi:hypothetical protein
VVQWGQGHFVAALGRFPYLFLNLGTYSQVEQWCYQASGPRSLVVYEELLCITAASFTSSISLTMTECPKVRSDTCRLSMWRICLIAGETASSLS